VDIIHLLNETVMQSFEFLNHCCKQKEKQNKFIEIKNEEDEYSDCDNAEDEFIDIDKDDYIEELKYDFSTSFSEEYEKKSKEIFTSQKIKTKNSINLISAIKYIFSSKVDNDFSNEINYLFENDVLPKRNKRLELSMIEKESNEKDYWKVFQERIEKLYNEVNNKFKNDPLYTQIMKYFNELAQAKKTDKLKVVPEKIQFYEEYVDNFPYFKQVFIMGREVKEYLKILDLENNSLEKLQLINLLC